MYIYTFKSHPMICFVKSKYEKKNTVMYSYEQITEFFFVFLYIYIYI